MQVINYVFNFLDTKVFNRRALCALKVIIQLKCNQLQNHWVMELCVITSVSSISFSKLIFKYANVTLRYRL